MPAEWLAWHEKGALKRILLRKGKLSGYWTEQDERKLATDLSLNLHGQSVSAKIQGLRFTHLAFLKALLSGLAKPYGSTPPSAPCQ